MEDNKNKQVELLVFDLNGTFYKKHSKDEFFKFILSKSPGRLKYIFKMNYYRVLKMFNKINHTEFKENFFDYLNNIPPDEVEELAREFWDLEYPKNFNQELKNHFDDCKTKGMELVCVTGGFENYVRPLFDKHYSINHFSGTRTTYDNGTYTIVGEACKGAEKIKRLDEFYEGKKYRIVEGYSDSEEEFFNITDKAFMVKDGKVVPYKNEN